MKVIAGIIVSATIALVSAVIMNTLNTNLNASEIKHEREVRVMTDKSLKDSLDKQNKHLENIEAYLRKLSEGSNRL